jgi:hypothetical protein
MAEKSRSRFFSVSPRTSPLWRFRNLPNTQDRDRSGAGTLARWSPDSRADGTRRIRRLGHAQARRPARVLSTDLSITFLSAAARITAAIRRSSASATSGSERTSSRNRPPCSTSASVSSTARAETIRGPSSYKAASPDAAGARRVSRIRSFPSPVATESATRLAQRPRARSLDRPRHIELHPTGSDAPLPPRRGQAARRDPSCGRGRPGTERRPSLQGSSAPPPLSTKLSGVWAPLQSSRAVERSLWGPTTAMIGDLVSGQSPETARSPSRAPADRASHIRAPLPAPAAASQSLRRRPPP